VLIKNEFFDCLPDYDDEIRNQLFHHKFYQLKVDFLKERSKISNKDHHVEIMNYFNTHIFQFIIFKACKRLD